MNIYKSLKVLVLAVLFSFIWGLWWGYKKIEMRDPIKSAKIKLSVLAPSNIFDQKLVDAILSEKKIYLNIEYYDRPTDFLKKIYAADQNFDLIFFSSFLSSSLMFDQHFAVLSARSMQALNQISVDFLNLSYDPENKYTIPLLWGVNGFVVKSTNSTAALHVSNVLKDQKTSLEAKFITDPAEVFSLLNKVYPILGTWLDTGQKESIRKEIKSIIPAFKTSKNVVSDEALSKNMKIIQLSNGRAADFTSQSSDWKFILPEERANLWVLSGAVGKNSKNNRGAEYLLELLTESKWALEQMKNSREASTLVSLNSNEKISELRKAKFIRSLPMSKIELFSRHEVYEPLFMDIVREDLSLPQ